MIIITSNTSKDSVIQALSLGAYDYLQKNSDRTRFLTTFHRAVEYRKLRQTLADVSDSSYLPRFGIMGVSPGIRAVVAQTARLAARELNVLISGETGTGKDLVARGLHHGSNRDSGPIISINCAASPTDVLESELFGREQDQGGVPAHVGAFERADKGTLFLNEVGELDLTLQAKLLKAIEEKRFFRVGGTKEIASDFRLVAATNRDLFADGITGRFRKDLYYRLSVTEINLPPLRCRIEDIPVLANHFLKELNGQLGKNVQLSLDTVAMLMEYPWPGNARELQNAIHHGLIQCPDETFRPCHLPERIRRFVTDTTSISGTPALSVLGAGGSVLKPLEQQEREAIVRSLKVTDGKIPEAAKLLGVSRASMYRMVKRHNILTKGYG